MSSSRFILMGTRRGKICTFIFSDCSRHFDGNNLFNPATTPRSRYFDKLMIAGDEENQGADSKGLLRSHMWYVVELDWLVRLKLL